ncbi:MAG: 30S ribosomal protein S2 [Candidatus Moranbacteria bacterium]|nr:30S ribosomal protein S2 [Candidatus Moranbacteria bacterium]
MAEAIVEAGAEQEGLKKDTPKENYFSMADSKAFDVSLEGLLKAGVHFGHLKSRRHPKMDEYIYTTRKNINILNLQKTSEKLEQAAKFLSQVVKSGKPILFVGMKKQTHDTVQSLAQHVGQYYMVDRWLGGTLTNFAAIRGRARHLVDLEARFASGEFKKYTKFEQAKKMEEVARLEKKVGGIKGMEDFPAAIVIADTKEAGLVLHEASKMGVPVVGIVDTNTDPSAVDYPIPANDDALSSLRLLFGYLGQAVLAAKAAAKEVKEQPAVVVKA